MKRLVLSIAAVTLMNAALALTPLQEAEFAVQQGHFAQAEAMMQSVIAESPGNARAHYRYAELLARKGNVRAAAEEARAARGIDPKITFADPANFRLFEATLSEQQVMQP
jgi:tetratricopeptide (TPR) repeat protein